MCSANPAWTSKVPTFISAFGPAMSYARSVLPWWQTKFHTHKPLPTLTVTVLWVAETWSLLETTDVSEQRSLHCPHNLPTSFYFLWSSKAPPYVVLSILPLSTQFSDPPNTWPPVAERRYCNVGRRAKSRSNMLICHSATRAQFYLD